MKDLNAFHKAYTIMLDIPKTNTEDSNSLSVAQAAKICGVGRSTIGYWVRSKKLMANRIGRKYFIPVSELLYFLKTSGYTIPEDLSSGSMFNSSFRSFKTCWNYWENSHHGHYCSDCVVLSKTLTPCFTAKCSSRLKCPKPCSECDYYLDYYFPKINFLSQIEVPALVYRDLIIWGGNAKIAEMFGIDVQEMMGVGLESIMHPDSLGSVICLSKKRGLNDPEVPLTSTIFIKDRRKLKLKVSFSVLPLNEPKDGFLALVEPDDPRRFG